MKNIKPSLILIKLVLVLIFTSVSLLVSANSTADVKNQYQGQEKRQIKSLSASDIDSLRNGKGWGLAKAAELNGIPGPSHILQMKNQIQLRPEQEKQISKLFAEMKSKAINTGLKLIELEKDLEIAFQTKNINKDSLLKKLTKISETRRNLRFIHLSTHLATPNILDREQIVRYNHLRGYGKPTQSILNGNTNKHHHQH